MSKVTKKERISTLERQLSALITLVKMKGYNEVNQRIEALEEFATYADNMLTELNHALPDPEYDAECEAQEADVDASLDRHRERLGLNKPQLKQLDQSVFDGLDEKWRFAAVNTDGKAYLHNEKKDMMYFNHSSYGWCSKDYDRHEMQLIGNGFDPSGFAVGFIERDDIAKELLDVDLSSELTGSDLAKDYFKRGCCPRVCFVGEDDDECLSDLVVAMVIGYVEGKGFETSYNDFFPCAAMVNSYGDELTASEVGL